MKQIILVLLIVVLCGSSSLCPQNFLGKQRVQPIVIEPPEEKLSAHEELVYSLQWLGFPIGRLVLRVQGLEVIRGSSCYHIQVRVFPNSFFKKFFYLEYIVDTYLDEKSLSTFRFKKERRVKNKSNFLTVDFNYDTLQAEVQVSGSGEIIETSPAREVMQKQIATTNRIEKNSQDLFSALYYFRLQNIQPGGVYPVTVYYDSRNWPLNFVTRTPFMREMRKRGSFPLVRVEIESELVRYIVGKRGLYAYFTTDSHRVPFEFTLSTFIGPIKGLLQHSPYQ